MIEAAATAQEPHIGAGDAEPTLAVEELKTHFFTKAGVVKAVDGVSFSIKRGEVLGIVGESGSGKSITGLSIIGLIDPPGRIVSGAIRFKGRDLTKLSEEEIRQLRGDRIAMIFQDPMMALNPVLRIDTQIIEAVRAHHDVDRGTALEMAREALSAVGIPAPERRLKAYPHELSGGMRQRVAIARTLILRPRIILMDEPFGALDPTTRMSMQDLLVRLWREVEATVFFITHSIEEAVYLGDRVYLMSNSPGTILEEMAITPPDRPAMEMQREPRFLETVYYIRDRIFALEQMNQAEG